MKKKAGFALVITLLLGVPVFADTFAMGDVIGITGVNNATLTVFWTGSFTLGSSAGGSLWNVSAFSVDPPGCTVCSPTNPAWTLCSFEFDGATGDLLGTAQANFSGLGIGVHLLTLTFVDGNNTSDAWSDFNAKFGTTKTGTFSYCTGTGCGSSTATPEPSAYMLLASGLISLAGAVGRRLKRG